MKKKVIIIILSFIALAVALLYIFYKKGVFGSNNEVIVVGEDLTPIKKSNLIITTHNDGEVEKHYYQLGKDNQKITNKKENKTGYTFIGWAIDEKSNKVVYEDDIIINDNLINSYNNELDLYAVYEANTYNIIFDCDGGENPPHNQSIKYNSDFTLTGLTCQKAGYVQDGWTDEDNKVWKVNEKTNVKWTYTKDINLKAIWVEDSSKAKVNTYEVTFDCNGGENPPATQVGIENEMFTLTNNTCERTGYVQGGWIDVNNNTWNTSNKTNIKWTYTKNITLKAVWTPIKVIVTFNSNGGTGTSKNQIFTYGNTTQTISNQEMTKNGYIQLGWALSPSSTVPNYSINGIIDNEFISSYSPSITLYAVWSKKETNTTTNKYQINFDCNSGQGTVNAQSVTYGASYTLTNNTCQKEGYYQDGWFVDNKNVWRVKDKTNVVWTYKKNISLKANWIKKESKIHFTNYYTNPEASSTEGILIESNGHYGLIDASNPTNSPYSAYNYTAYNGTKLGEYIKSNYKNVDTPHLDFIIMSHAHSDHTGGVPLLYDQKLIDENTVYIYKTFDNLTNKEKQWHTAWYYDEAIKTIEKANAKKLSVDNHKSSELSALNAKFVSKGGNEADYIEYQFYDLNIKIFNTHIYFDRKTTTDNINSLIVLITNGTQKVLLMSESNRFNALYDVAKMAGHVSLLKGGHYTSNGFLTLGTLTTTTPNTLLLTGASSGKQYNGDLGSAIAYMNTRGGTVIGNEDIKSPIVAKIDSSKITLYSNNSGTYKALNSNNYLKSNLTSGFLQIADRKDFVWIYAKDNKLLKGFNEINYNGKKYTFYFQPTSTATISEGVMATGWRQIGEKWYYFAEETTTDYPEGAMAKGWKKLKWSGKEGTYYFNTSGQMVIGWQKIDGKWYYFQRTSSNGIYAGSMLVGWQSLEWNGATNKYYFGSNGVMKTGWLKLNDKWYYFNSSGAMQTGTKEIGGKTYVFDSNGVCIQGNGC